MHLRNQIRNVKIAANLRIKVSAEMVLPVIIFILKKTVKNTVLMDLAH